MIKVLKYLIYIIQSIMFSLNIYMIYYKTFIDYNVIDLMFLLLALIGLIVGYYWLIKYMILIKGIK